MHDDEEEPNTLSESAQAAMDMAEANAEERRQKHLQDDQEKAVRAQSGNSKMSSGMRVDADGGAIPGVEGRPDPLPPVEPMAPIVRRDMPEATLPPPPQSLEKLDPTGKSAAEILVPADAQTTAREEAGRAAFALVEEQRATQRKAHKEVKRDVMFYVRCQRCGGPGIWMVKRGVIQADDWWSNYKPRGVPWPSKDIWCQCCWAIRGAQNSLKILHDTVNGRVRSVTPYPRMIVEILTSEYARLVAAPEPEPVTADGTSGP